MVITPHEATKSGLIGRPGFLIALVLLATLLGVGFWSPFALIGALLDGVVAIMVMLPPMLMGLWCVPLLRLGSLPIRWHLLVGAVLGLGIVATLALVCGTLGVMQRSVWIPILAACTVTGSLRLRMLLSSRSPVGAEGKSKSSEESNRPGLSPFHYLWLLAVPFCVAAIVASSNAPGFIWKEEGYGYDVLEYHLQVPKEYIEAGAITYLPHNVYANLPANVEMLYMLSMIVLDDINDAGTTANMIHLLLGVLTVAAAWVAGREYSARAGVVCGVVMATVGWLTYLSGLAYVENGLLFFGVTAMAAAIRFCKSPTTLGWVVLSGIAAGFACGCKSTALPMIALPLAIFIVSTVKTSMRQRLVNFVLFSAATAVAFSPWLIKNQALTGNPVFPLVNDLFEAAPPGWGEAETQIWNRGHAPPPLNPEGLSKRAQVLGQLLATDEHQRLGPCITLLALAGLMGRKRNRIDLLLVLMVAIQLGVWLFATHLLLRFSVILVIPLALLCARAVGDQASIGKCRMIGAVLIIGATWNGAFAIQLIRAEQAQGAPASLIYDGELPGFEYFGAINHDLPRDAKILLVGDAKGFYYQRRVDYCVTFNHNPFFERVLSNATNREVMQWIRDRGYTHVLVHWNEVRRLSATYGFSPPVDQNTLATRLVGMQADGLEPVQEFAHEAISGRYVTLYSVVQN